MGFKKKKTEYKTWPKMFYPIFSLFFFSSEAGSGSREVSKGPRLDGRQRGERSRSERID